MRNKTTRQAILSLFGLAGLLALQPILAHLTLAHACGPDTDCLIGERTYRIRMPEKADDTDKVGAIIFNHGYRGSAAGTMRNKRLGKTVSNMGLAFVAAKSWREDWDIPNAPTPGQDSEIAYFKALKRALVKDHNVDPNKIMVTGFSAGGMMVWNLACRLGEEFAAYAPMAGTFWAPVPQECATLPVNLIHVHGTSDTIVPLKGRPIGSTRQGDVYKALDLAARTGDHGAWQNAGKLEGLSCQKRPGEHILQFCTHSGGHTFKSQWLAGIWNLFDRAGVFAN